MKKRITIILFALTAINVSASTPTIQWQKSLGGSGNDRAYSIAQTNDGGYVVTGIATTADGDVTVNHGSNDFWLVKLDSAGTKKWQKSYGGSGNETPNSVIQTSDGGYLMAGSSSAADGDVTKNYGTDDVWLVKTDSAGTLQWQKSYGGSGSEYALFVAQATDGNYLFVGYSTSSDSDLTINHGGYDCWVVKTDTAGTILWKKTYGGSGNDFTKSVQPTSDGGCIISGETSSSDGDITGSHGGTDLWLIKLDTAGTIKWQKVYGGSGSDGARFAEQTADGGYIATGYSNSTNGDVTGNHGNTDAWVLKTDSAGIIQWQKSLGGSNSDDACVVHATTDGGYMVAAFTGSTDGDVTSNHGGNDYWVVKLDSTSSPVWQKTFGGTNNDRATSLQLTTDGGIVVSGYSSSTDVDVTGNHGSSDFWVVKLTRDSLLTANTEHSSVNNQENISIYPNPASAAFTISSEGRKIKEITVVNISGEIVYRSVIDNFQTRIDLSKEAKGIYIIKITDNNNNETNKKIILQ